MSLAGGKAGCPLRSRWSLRGAPRALVLVCLSLLGAALVLPAAPASAAPQQKRERLPANFFGVSPNEGLPSAPEFEQMRRGGIRSYRVPLGWSVAWPNPGTFNWEPFDRHVAGAAAAGIGVLPIIYSTPRWVGIGPSTLPVDSLIQRDLWEVFLGKAVRRYGPRGSFWSAHRELPYRPIRAWQIWNEENGVWFTDPVSVSRYARLLRISSRSLRNADPKAKVVLGGLYGRPSPTGGALWAKDFLSQLYRFKRIRRTFDVVALHPYAGDVEAMRSQIVEVRNVMNRHRDAGTPIWIDEFGWGSGTERLSFDKGPEGQRATLVAAFKMLIENQRRWKIGRTYWFPWEDAPPPACYYCVTGGLFTTDLRPKPAWYGYVGVTGGQS
jgi:hypothetical protein